MKKIIVIILIIFTVVSIYLTNVDHKEYVFKVGDSVALGINSYGIRTYDNYIMDYLKNKNIYENYINYGEEDYKIGELSRDIDNNIMISNKHIKNILIKADLVILSIGIDDLTKRILPYSNYNMYNYLDDLVSDMNDLIIKVRQYCKEKIVLIGYYNPQLKEQNQDYINYINKKYIELSKKYNINYVDISMYDNKYFSNPSNYYLNDEGYKKINQEIINLIYK